MRKCRKCGGQDIFPVGFCRRCHDWAQPLEIIALGVLVDLPPTTPGWWTPEAVDSAIRAGGAHTRGWQCWRLHLSKLRDAQLVAWEGSDLRRDTRLKIQDEANARRTLEEAWTCSE